MKINFLYIGEAKRNIASQQQCACLAGQKIQKLGVETATLRQLFFKLNLIIANRRNDTEKARRDFIQSE